MPGPTVCVGVGVGDADVDDDAVGDAVGDADPSDAPDAGVGACGVPGPDPRLAVLSGVVAAGVGWPFAGEA